MSLRQARQDEICVRLENFQWVEGNASGKKGKEKWPLNEWPKQPWLAESPGAIKLHTPKEKIRRSACREITFTTVTQEMLCSSCENNNYSHL
ncbi:hypothetical protein CBR65_09650 [Cellvibrio sp. PSBB006]|nr:hypothetical protein CBR65_09650 [Cellvibrio sp. PSBB006]